MATDEKVFGDDAEVTVWASDPHTYADEGPTVAYEKAVVRFRTASGNVDVWVHQGKLRLTTVSAGEGQRNGIALAVRPRGASTIDVIPGL